MDDGWAVRVRQWATAMIMDGCEGGRLTIGRDDTGWMMSDGDDDDDDGDRW